MPKTGKSLRILGLDPGMAVTGWGVIEHTAGKSELLAHGTISTSAREAPHERLMQIHDGVIAAIELHQPDCAAIEELFGGVNLKTALAVGQARGVIVLACAERGLAPADYTPLRIKQAVVGYGRASKVQVQQMVKALLSLPKVPKPDHAADALAVAICHAHSMRNDYEGMYGQAIGGAAADKRLAGGGVDQQRAGAAADKQLADPAMGKAGKNFSTGSVS